MRDIIEYIQTDLGLPLTVQAERSGLSRNTLGRWLSKESEPSGDRLSAYLTWALGAVCDPLHHDSGDGACASIPRGVRLYSAVVGEAGAWRWLLIALDGRQLHRYQSGTSAVPSLAALREQLVQLASSWCAPLRAADRPAPRVASASSVDRRYWSAQSALQAAQIRLWLAQGLAARGDLTEEEQAASLAELQRALAEVAAVGAELRGAER